MDKENYDKINYKALSPIETIMNLRKILHDFGVFAYESQWWEIENKNLVSLLILLDTNHKVHTSGKGVNRQYALASGLAEMLERMQNLQFTKVVSSCTENITYNHYDSKIISYNQINTLKYFLPKHKQYLHLLAREKEVTVVPFYNVFKDTVEYFPFMFLWSCTGSNGMCAGNTPQEALIQGICEIFERHVLYKIYFENLVLPTIPVNTLKDTCHWQYISMLEENGFSVEIKDCSLNGKLPVMGILVSKDNKACFCAGAAPDFNVALERCFIETMQGRDIDSLYETMPEIKKMSSKKELVNQYMLSLRSHSGVLPGNIFKNEGQVDENNLFWTSNQTSKDTLNRLINIIQGMGYDLFIRDVSFLGFPTYHVYVPGMSDTVANFRYGIHLETATTKLRRIFFNLNEATKNDLSLLAKAIDKKIQHSNKNNTSFDLLSLFNMPYRENSSLNTVSPDIFLIVLYCRLKVFNKALARLSSFLKKHPPGDTRSKETFNCFQEMLVLLKKGILLSKVNRKLASKYPSSILQENSMIIDGKYPLNEIFGVPEPDNCSECNVCYFKELQDLGRKLSKKMAGYHYNQIQLKNVLT